MRRSLIHVAINFLLLVSLVSLSACASKPIELNFNPNAGETKPNQYKSSLRYGFVTFEDHRTAKEMGDPSLIGWGSNTFYIDVKATDQVTKAFVDAYKYLGFNATWIKTPPTNFSFSTRSWVRTLRSLYPNIDIFVIGKLQNYEFLLRSGGLSGITTGTFTSLSVTTQVRVELYYLDSQTGKIIWGNGIHHDTFDEKATKTAPTDFAAVRLEEALQNVILQSVDRSIIHINKFYPSAVHYISDSLANVPKTPEGTPAGNIPPGKGRLEVISNPSGAMVYVDGIYYGPTPLALDLDPGIHLLKVKKSGYETSRDKVGVLEGKPTPWNGVLPKKN